MSWRGARQRYADQDASPFPPVDEAQQHVTMLPTHGGAGVSFGASPAQTLPGAVLGGFLLGSDALGASPRDVPGAFIRDAGLTAGTLGGQNQYVQPMAGDRIGRRPTIGDRVGGFAIGRSAVGHRRGLHGRIELGVPPGRGETETRG